MTRETPPPPAPATRARGRLVVLVSGTGSNLEALLAAHDDPAYGARVVAVVSDREGIRALDIARAAGIPTAVVSVKDFEDRAAWDAAVTETVAVFSPDVVVLAGFMKLFGATFLGRFGGPDHQHPPRPAAVVPRRARRAGRARVRRDGHGVHGHGGRRGHRHRTDPRAGGGAPWSPTTTRPTLHERIKTVERALLVEWVGRIAREGLRVEGRRAIVG